MKHNDLIKLVNDIASIGKDKGFLHLTTEDEFYNGRTIKIKNHILVNFGSYAYLGLNLNEQIKTGAINAIIKFGTQLPSSRAYLSGTLYTEFEHLLHEIFQVPLVICNSTTLGHQATLPNIIGLNDIVILDQQVHSSVQESAKLLKTLGIKIIILRHNDTIELEKKIIELSKTYKKIWYLADGVYSMYGDFAPVKELEYLLNKHKKFHLYIDDAHGISWAGKHGSGYVLSQIKFHKKMILIASLNKGFGSGGAVILLPNNRAKEKIRNVGSNLIFAGQLPSSSLGGGIECAKIHLSDEFVTLQTTLQEKSLFLHKQLLDLGLPIISDTLSPIKFIPLGKPSAGYNMVKRLIEEGFYVNLAIFPAVSSKKTGLRITITTNLLNKDLKNLALAINKHYYHVLAEENSSINDVIKVFRHEQPFRFLKKYNQVENTHAKQKFIIKHFQSILEINKKEWNDALGDRGMFDWNGLQFIESVFKNNIDRKNNWHFHYLLIYNDKGKLSLATFFTIGLSKDDLLSSQKKSVQVEKQRLVNPNLLISKSLILGSLITEGDHLFIDRKAPGWDKLFYKFLNVVSELHEKHNTDSVYLRDFKSDDLEIKNLLLNNGFIPISMPKTSELLLNGWHTPEEYLNNFTHKKRYYIKQEILKFSKYYTIKIGSNISLRTINKMYNLYMNVKKTSFELNGFDLPIEFFENMVKNNSCDILQLYINPEYSKSGKSEMVSVTFNYLSETGNYCGIILGLDYDYIKTHNLYKQTIYQAIIRAKTLNSKKMFLGLTSSMIKSKLGANHKKLNAFVQVNDTLKNSIIDFIG